MTVSEKNCANEPSEATLKALAEEILTKYAKAFEELAK